MRPYVQTNTPTIVATTSTQSVTPTSAAITTPFTNDTTTATSIARPAVHSDDVIASHHSFAPKNSSYPKRSYDDAKRAFLNYSPSDNYVYPNSSVNQTKSPSQPQYESNTPALWSTHLLEPSQSKRCIDSASTTTVVTSIDDKRKCSIGDNNDNKFLSKTSFDDSVVNSASSMITPSFTSPKYGQCDSRFADNRSTSVDLSNTKASGGLLGATSPSSSNGRSEQKPLIDIQDESAELVVPMAASFNSNNNCETSSNSQKCRNTEETTALLIGNDPSRTITVRKANNNSLIFTKKDPNPVVHRKNVFLRAKSGIEQPTFIQANVEEKSSNKRHSFHLQNNGGAPSDDCKRKQVKSWYAIISSAGATGSVDEDLEQQHSNYNNLADAKEPNGKISHEKMALLDQPQLLQSWRGGGKQTATPITRQSNSNEPVANGRETVSKYNRFEQLLKNLVGRKVSRDAAATTTSATKMLAANTPPTFSRQSSMISTETNQYPDTSAIHCNENRNGDVDAKPGHHPVFTSPADHVNRNFLRSNSHFMVDSASASTTSLNSVVQRKLWNVMPLLRREDSCTSLYQNSTKPLIHQHYKTMLSGLKKCETVQTLSNPSATTSFEPIKAQNRLRHSQSIATCSRCSSILSLAANGSKYSLNAASGGGFVAIGEGDGSTAAGSNVDDANEKDTLLERTESPVTISCKLCLCDVADDNVTAIEQCGCKFCTDCMKAYVEFEIQEGAYEISCPDALCPGQGVLSLNSDINALVTSEYLERHKRFRLNREIELDKNRTWCPRAGCETVCVVGPIPTTSDTQTNAITSLEPIPVKCPTCVEEFCSSCKKSWHSDMTCEENARRLAASGADDSIGISFDTDLIKCCPMCGVPIEKDEGCAQMMCKRCKHVFCWYCLASLDDDFLLRHYDKGPCKNKLGHSRASVVWHRAQVIGIFAGFGLLLLVASPLLLLAAPCIVCCKCRICSSSAKLEDADTDFDDANR